LLLAERTRWPEGRWLAIDLATACERRDTRASGELETIAALVGGDMLLPGEDASVPFTGLLEQSVTHAVGVSKDLRDGVRESIEVVAQEVLDRRRRAGLTDGDSPEERADLARRLTRESLRHLYRVLFLLYAEARPELGILPVKAPEYAAGYGLDRLRELVQVDLTTDRARHGVHLYESIQRLVDLVDRGHTGGEDGLTFESLRADLFAPTATPLIDEVQLGNEAVQRVLDRLLLSRKKRGRDRGFVSYAQLGINQLGAVYEGLMSYQGRIADDHLIEVAKDGDPDKGSWLMSESDWATAGLPDTVLVHREDPETGERRRVRHRPGDFVLRLSGRDRQRSASYYTPQVLTACVVRHSLAELLDQPVDPEQPDGERRRTTAAEILGWRICEPALGSGAFLVEAIDQIAATYLTRAQAERGEQIDPDAYPGELQKVKAYLALHNCYGVDLNATAVELAEITLWLASMHPGLQAPWFGLRLRRGNSLIGARRAGYEPADFAKATWWKEVPTDVALGEDWPAGYVHHFLLPSAGWGAVADTKEARELEPDRTAALKEWRRGIRRAPSKDHAKRLQALARRVEVLWGLARMRLELAEAESRRDIDVWGAEDLPVSRGAVSREQIEASLNDANGAYQRLRLAMDAWCAMWFWPVHRGTPPTWDQWVRALEAYSGTTTRRPGCPGNGESSRDRNRPTAANSPGRAWATRRPPTWPWPVYGRSTRWCQSTRGSPSAVPSPTGRASSTGNSTLRPCSSPVATTCRSATRPGCGPTGRTTWSSPRSTRGSPWPSSPRQPPTKTDASRHCAPSATSECTWPSAPRWLGWPSIWPARSTVRSSRASAPTFTGASSSAPGGR
jgi:hypothetical protein